ncbi:hypothetical protein SK3146_06580 [Paenibacillus konkukensis]|uniref:Uncharacterized protein n=1 Tax=Paenibacillus konkukensis TaxID=2020716 RepID=A0ABY4S144_9BACL|nr:hypothetical protein [Paenibacillus konkukensis]UQZ87283.1 hypothetical protein SK3146_06580 [Paenibacillus konkukensis]
MLFVSIAIAFSIFAFLLTLEIYTLRKLKKKIFRCFERNMSWSKKKHLQKDPDYLFNEVRNLSPHLRRKLKFIVRNSTDDSTTAATFNGMTVIVSVTLSMMAIMVSVFSLLNDQVEEKLLVVLFDMLEYLQYFLVYLGMAFLQYAIRIRFIESTKDFLNKFSVAIDEVEIELAVIPHPSEAQYLTRSASEDHRQC